MLTIVGLLLTAALAREIVVEPGAAIAPAIEKASRGDTIRLRPGVYLVTFSLEGFATFKREGLELPSNFTATINAEMRIGAGELWKCSSSVNTTPCSDCGASATFCDCG